jgi:hypothetical protein
MPNSGAKRLIHLKYCNYSMNQLEECCKEQGRLAEASEEGLGSNWAVAPMMMMMTL